MSRLFLLTFFCLTLFALNSILCRAALIVFNMDSLQYVAIRILSAAFTLALLCFIHIIPQKSQESIWRSCLKQSSWIGAFFLFIYMLSFSLAYLRISSAAGTLFLNVSVQFSMIGWAAFKGLYPSTRQIAGLIIAFLGMIALLLPGLSAPPFGSSILMIISGLSWGGYTIVGRSSTSAAHSTAGNFFRCIPLGVVLLLISLYLYNPPGIWALLCALSAGSLASALGYVLWYFVVPRFSLTSASIIQLSVPLITAILAVILLGEAITLRLVLCSIPILGGIALALIANKTPSSN